VKAEEGIIEAVLQCCLLKISCRWQHRFVFISSFECWYNLAVFEEIYLITATGVVVVVLVLCVCVCVCVVFFPHEVVVSRSRELHTYEAV